MVQLKRVIIGFGALICITWLMVIITESQYETLFETDEENEWYSEDLPDKYSLKYANKKQRFANIYKKEKLIAKVQVNPGCTYQLTASSIVSNFMGRHAYIKGDVETKEGTTKEGESYQRFKILVGFKPSAAEEIRGESTKEQQHYFYVKGDWLVDLMITDDEMGVDEMELLADCIEIK